MRVAINTLAVDPRRPGGDGTYVRELVRHLVQLDDDAQYALLVAGSNRSLFPSPGARVRHILCPVPGRSLLVRAIWEQLALPRFVHGARPDVLHAPVNVAPLAVSVPSVLTLLEAEPFLPFSEMPWALRAYWRVVRSASARKASRILAISDSSRRELRHFMHVPASKMTTVHLGIDTDRFCPPPAGQKREDYILWVGRSYPRKNLLRLLEAYASLSTAVRQQHPLVLLGVPGWADARLRRSVDVLGLDHQVRFAGRMPDADLPGWFQRARMFVFPSLHEAFGLPVLEALACGTPVLAADIPALREIAGDAASFVEPTSVPEIARGLQRLLQDPLAAARGSSAGPERASHFTWDGAARATRVEYAQAVA